MKPRPPSLTSLQTLALTTLVAGASSVWAAPYELRVYSDDIPRKNEVELELIVSAAKPKLSNEGPRETVFQTLVEFGLGIGNGWAIGLELPMSNLDGHTKINGVKIEAQYVNEHNPHQGMYWGVRSDVGYTSSPYETHGGNTVDINPIVGIRWDRWHLVVNPSVEIPLSGTNTKTQFQPSAKLAHWISGNSQVGMEYFSGWGAIASVRPQHQRDETLYLVWDERLSHSRWNLGLGKPMNPSGGSIDQWVIKIGVNVDLD